MCDRRTTATGGGTRVDVPLVDGFGAGAEEDEGTDEVGQAVEVRPGLTGALELGLTGADDGLTGAE